MTNGERLNFVKNVFLPVATRTARPHRPSSCDQSYKVKSKPPKSPTPTASTTETAVAEEDVGGGGGGGDDDWSPIWEFLPNSEKHPKTKDTYQSVAVILFVGVAFLIFMVVTMRMLFNVFKFKQGDDQQSSKNRKKSSSRSPRRTGSAISRRARRASSITSARST